jgi:ribonuclease VapC
LVAQGRHIGDNLNRLIKDTGLLIRAFTQKDLQYATEALMRFGKGRHAAALNFGDCAAYGLAKRLNAPLLFKGEDFSRTDIKAVWRPGS